MSTSCEKDDPIVPEQTLAEQYPDWVNLTWVSTDDNTNLNTYPKLTITIISNEVKVIHPTDQDAPMNKTFDKMLVNSDGTFIIGNINGFHVYGTYVKNGTLLVLTTFGLLNDSYPINEHKYVLQINSL